MSISFAEPLTGSSHAPLKVSAAVKGRYRPATVGVTQDREDTRVVMRNKFLKALCDIFLSTCAPCEAVVTGKGLPRKPDFETVFDGVPPNPRLEQDMYDPLCEAFTRLCPGYVCLRTSESPDANDWSKQKVDLALFSKANAPHNERPNWPLQALHIEVKRNAVADDPFDDTEGAIFQLNADERTENRDQITSYAEMLFKWQHRAFCFTVIVFGHYARIIRWDRSGAVVTEKIDYHEHPEHLAEFFWRFAHMTPEEQGYDTTVTSDLSPAERSKMRRVGRTVREQGDYARQLFKTSLEDPDYPMSKITVDVEDQDEVGSAMHPQLQKQFLVGKPHYIVNNIIGRCTRGYVALDAQTDELVWLKDAWRVDLPRICKEGDTLRRLKQASVEHVPTFLCHGDVPRQETLADKVWQELYGGGPADYPEYDDDEDFDDDEADEDKQTDTADETGSDESWSTSQDDQIAPNAAECSSAGATTSPEKQQSDIHEDDMQMNPLKPHKHYRLVTKEVCRPLDDFRNCKELIIIIYHCVLAHSQAYNNLSLLHRDISAGNVLIYEWTKKGKSKTKRSGILADWELARTIRKRRRIGDLARQPDRTGTWQFLSALSLRNSRKPITLQDDLESFHHLIIYQGIRWIPNTCTQVALFMRDYFDEKAIHAGTREFICGATKFRIMEKGKLEYQGTVIEFHSGQFGGRDTKEYPLTQLLQRTAAMFYAWYQFVHRRFPALYASPAVENTVDTIVVSGSDESQSTDSDDSDSDDLDSGDSDEDDDDLGVGRDPELATYLQNKLMDAPEHVDGVGEDYTIAGRLSNHTHFLEELHKLSRSKKWPKVDKLDKDKRDPLVLVALKKAVSNSDQVQSGQASLGSGMEPQIKARAQSRRPTTSEHSAGSTSSKRPRSESMSRASGHPQAKRRPLPDSVRGSMPPPPARPAASRTADSSGSSRRTRSSSRRERDRVHEGSSKGPGSAQSSDGEGHERTL